MKYSEVLKDKEGAQNFNILSTDVYRTIQSGYSELSGMLHFEKPLILSDK